MLEAHLDAAGRSLQDPHATGDFIAALRQPLTDAISDPALLRGLRAEALFESLVVSLGGIQLIKQEDSGAAWTGRPHLKIPDYRIVLLDGTQFLAEVKHFHQGGKQMRPFAISKSYLRGLREYEELVGCPVKLAVYWSAWNQWTLVPLDVCEESERPSLTLPRAIEANEMSELGDLWVGTVSPLRLRFVADTASPRRVSGDGTVTFTIADVQVFCGDRQLTRKREQSIAMWFMLYGSWEEKATAEIHDRQLVAMEFVGEPSEDTGQGFALVGTLSGLFSSMYLSSTSEGGAVSRLGVDVSSGSLASLIPADYESDELPVWRFRIVGTLAQASDG